MVGQVIAVHAGLAVVDARRNGLLDQLATVVHIAVHVPGRHVLQVVLLPDPVAIFIISEAQHQIGLRGIAVYLRDLAIDIVLQVLAHRPLGLAAELSEIVVRIGGVAGDRRQLVGAWRIAVLVAGDGVARSVRALQGLYIAVRIVGQSLLLVDLLIGKRVGAVVGDAPSSVQSDVVGMRDGMSDQEQQLQGY